MKIRSYSELVKLETIKERYEYLKLNGSVGRSTFGFDRHINQTFYMSKEWRSIRKQIIIRDNGCDLGVDGFSIHKGLYIHHMNPMNVEDIVFRQDHILDPEYLITASLNTHNAIHYGDEKLLPQLPIVRSLGDTKLW